MDAGSSWLRLSSTRSGAEPVVEGDRIAGPARALNVTLNLRAAGDARTIEVVVRESLDAIGARVEIVRLDCFEPAAPKPERMIRA